MFEVRVCGYTDSHADDDVNVYCGIILRRAGSIFQSFCQIFYDHKSIMTYHASLLYSLIMEISKLITAILILAYNAVQPDE